MAPTSKNIFFLAMMQIYQIQNLNYLMIRPMRTDNLDCKFLSIKVMLGL